MSKGPKGAADFLMPRANSARGKVLGALPRSPARGTPPETPAPFPFAPIFQNGPRRPGFAGENLFNPSKDSPPPRLKRAPWTAAGRSEDLLVTRERGQMQRSTPPQPAVACRLPLAGPDRREMIVVDQTSTGGNHPKQVYRFQDHLVLETLLHFRIILGLEYARRDGGGVRVRPAVPVGFNTQAAVDEYLRRSIQLTFYVPHAVFLDRNGMIVGDFEGASDFMKNPAENTRKLLDQMLAVKVPAGKKAAVGTRP